MRTTVLALVHTLVAMGWCMPVSFLEQGPSPVFYGKQPMENFHDMLPPFGMSYQPLSQLPADHPVNQLGKREHVQWAGMYPQQWGEPFPHNSPVDTSRLSKKEEMYPGRAVSPFWWNQPPWWWKQGPWWIQKVKRRNNGQPYGVLGDGPDAFDKPKLPSPLSEFHQIVSSKQPDNKSNDSQKGSADLAAKSPEAFAAENQKIFEQTKFFQRKQDRDSRRKAREQRKKKMEEEDKLKKKEEGANAQSEEEDDDSQQQPAAATENGKD